MGEIIYFLISLNARSFVIRSEAVKRCASSGNTASVVRPAVKAEISPLIGCSVWQSVATIGRCRTLARFLLEYACSATPGLSRVPPCKHAPANMLPG